MESENIKDIIQVKFSNDEALVLLDWLTRFNIIDRNDLFQDQSEQRILWDLESILESRISETFIENYSEALKKARNKVKD